MNVRLIKTLLTAMLLTLPARAQWIDCLPDGQDLVKVPELVSSGGKLRATMLLTDEQQRITFRQPPGNVPSDTNRVQCAPQYVRVFRGIDAMPAPPARVG